MIDASELRLRLALWLHHAWPFRALTWLRLLRTPRDKGFGKFETLDEVVARLRAEIARLEKEQK